MKDRKLKILFMGSPEFAAACLRQLVLDKFDVVGVVTTPDRKKGRGQQIAESEVKKTALQYNIPVFQPTNLKDDSFVSELKDLDLDLGVVVAFRMLPEMVWNLPKMGTINLHASLLPNYRGAAPINWAIINGEKTTGITTFFLKHEIDTGDVILRKEVDIKQDMDAGDLHDVLMNEGAELLSATIELVQKGNYNAISQLKLDDNQALKKAPKIFKDDCRINWSIPSKKIYDFIRGLSPYPAAWSVFLTNTGKELTFKIFRSELTEMFCISKDKEMPQILSNKEELLLKTGDRYLRILEIQVEGKKRMKVKDFLKGFQTEGLTLK